MPFLSLQNHKQSKRNTNLNKKRKEADFCAHLKTILNSHTYAERASVFPSFRNVMKTKKCKKKKFRAVISLEAAAAFPLFFFAAVCLVYLLEMMAVRTSVRAGMQAACHSYAQEASVCSLTVPSRLEEKIVNSIGAERLDRSIVAGGSGGIDAGGSWASASGVLKLHISYKMKLPVTAFGGLMSSQEETMIAKGWTGYQDEWSLDEKEETVYVTENGIVYHKNYSCTYLDLSVHTVPGSTVGDLRNENHGKYHPCERCVRAQGPGVGVYITEQGNRYHNSASCSGLKRTVYAIPLSEAAGKGACSRCVK